MNRCPGCGAQVRSGAPWCSLCYADLRPRPAVPEPAPPAPPAEPSEPAEGGAAPAPGWPCVACGAQNPLGADACLSCGVGFLAPLRDTAPLVRLPGVGDVTRLDRGQRFLLAGAAVLAVVLLTALLGLL